MKVFPHPRRFLGNGKHLAGRPTILRPDSQPPRVWKGTGVVGYLEIGKVGGVPCVPSDL